jgi:hypothetical protein
MDGFQAVARVRQRPRHDHAHGVIEVGAFHLVEDGNGTDIDGTGGSPGFSSSVSDKGESDQFLARII